MDHQAASDFCRIWLPAWTGNHPEALLAFYAHDAFYRDPVHADGLRGREALFRYFRPLLAANPSWTWEATEIFPWTDGFCLKWKATIPVGAEHVVEHGLDIVEVQDGKIVRNEVYFDRAPLLKALSRR